MSIAEALDAFLIEVPEELQDRFREIVTITDQFCAESLNDEYRDICRRIAACICQPDSPVQRGKASSWAAGIVYEAGQVNFLTDPSSNPHLKSDEIAKGCGVSVATMHNKGRDIREALGLMRLDPDFTVPSRMQDNPLAWLMQLPNGAVVDVRNAPDTVREQLESAGLLPSANQPVVESDWRGRKLVPARTPRREIAYQLKLTLLHTEPAIWRRLIVPDCTLGDLHSVIQAAMNWQDDHLHEFVIAKRRFQSAMSLAFDFPMDEFEIEEDFLMSDLIPEKSRRPFTFMYVYDFGDYWEHEITVERVLTDDNHPHNPVCLEGQRAAPPEDCGGPWGYANLLEALADRKHPEHDQAKEWCGILDPDDFSVDVVSKELRSWKRVS